MATGLTMTVAVDLAEGIIDDSCLVSDLFQKNGITSRKPSTIPIVSHYLFLQKEQAMCINFITSYVQYS